MVRRAYRKLWLNKKADDQEIRGKGKKERRTDNVIC
jgi:hypothetical protein